MIRNQGNDLERILFWAERTGNTELDRAVNQLFQSVSAIFGVGDRHLGQPQDFVRRNIQHHDRTELAGILSAGQTLEAYFGYANCRICGETLGTKDLHGYGFIWPEKAEHYITNHNVWTEGCDKLLIAYRRSK